MSFKPVQSQIDFPAMEEDVLKFWKESGIFEKSIENRKGKNRFVFYEGPPTANGKPHMGHALQRSLKDLILRYRTMKGYLVERRAGWDTHGLPVEIEVEKELGLKGKQDILTLKDSEFESIKFFNEKCRDSVFRYVDVWKDLTKRIGFWIDFDSAYVTYHNEYIESIWWFLSEINKNGLLYKDYKVVPFCPRCGTSLSSHELAQGYKDDTEDPSVFIKFELIEEPGTYILVWTTTPWTLPGNVALAIGKDIKYLKVSQNGEKFILAESRLEVLEGGYEVLEEVKFDDLLGKSYKPLYEYLNPDKKAYFIAEADFASDQEGTGIVHTAVMYGVEDFELGKKLDLPMKHLVNIKGEFIPEVEKFAGRFVKSADKEIIEDLKQRNILYKSGTIKHTYPFCWRCSTPILYYALDTWFIKTTAVKEKLLEDNQKINWVPKTIKTGRMKNWLETLIDWNISRNRFWGTPLPIWECEEGHVKVIGSKDEIEEMGGKIPEDLHKPYIDEVVFDCSVCKKAMKRVADVADVWMDSGAMPFAQWHYPFENKEKFEEWYPADYIVEGIDQTRGWFFTLMAEAMLLDKSTPAPFKNVISTGLILDDKGVKMSKSKGNVIDPLEIIPLTGADTIRWYMFSGASAGENYLFSKEILKEKHRKFMLIFWNSYKFFVDYADLAGWEPNKEQGELTTLDRWIISKLNQLIDLVNVKLEAYDAFATSRSIEDFLVNDFSTWYIRRSRDRVGPDADPIDRQVCLGVMYEVLVTLTKLTAPMIPFISEEMYRNLTQEESVHLSDYPEPNLDLIDKQLIDQMVMVRQVAEQGHAIRKEAGIKLRQPLASVSYELNKKLDQGLEKIIAEELNVKEVRLCDIESDRHKHHDYIDTNSVKMDTNITPDLQEEGEARELIRQIQQLRKDQGLTLSDKTLVEAPNWPEKYKEQILNSTASISITEGSELKVTKS